MTEPMRFDDIVIGAGAAGLFYAGLSGQRGRSVCVIDHARKPAEKVRISGGGRCNFTNIHTAAHTFLSENPHFAKSALARYTPTDFCDLLQRRGVTWHEKTLGQLFCDQKSGAIIDVLLEEVEAGGGAIRLQTTVSDVAHRDGRFVVTTDKGLFEAQRLVIASGGLSIPKMGATGFAYDIARQFGHDVIRPRAGLVPFIFQGAEKEAFSGLAGVATDIRARAGEGVFEEAMLFTHRGLSGPAMLQVSSYWQPGGPISIDLLPGLELKSLKADAPRRTLDSALADHLPGRLVTMLSEQGFLPDGLKLADASHRQLDEIAEELRNWTLFPTDTEGWRTAEVTVGGIATSGLSSKTMESKNVRGLYFIGECVDVTGWLGGYNFQWAWASAHAAAKT